MPFEVVMIVFIVLIGLPWMIMHYMTRWKTAATLTSDDEVLLEELYNLAKRLDERMDTVERLVSSDDPSFRAVKRLQADHEEDTSDLHELEQLLAKQKEARQ